MSRSFKKEKGSYDGWDKKKRDSEKRNLAEKRAKKIEKRNKRQGRDEPKT